MPLSCTHKQPAYCTVLEAALRLRPDTSGLPYFCFMASTVGKIFEKSKWSTVSHFCLSVTSPLDLSICRIVETIWTLFQDRFYLEPVLPDRFYRTVITITLHSLTFFELSGTATLRTLRGCIVNINSLCT